MRALSAALFALAISGCRPDLGDSVSLVDRTRILAVRADPPETKPGEVVSYRALVASPGGTVAAPDVAWAVCTSPKPLTENNAVSTACLADGVSPIDAHGGTVAAATPLDACTLFGPDPPPGGFRPRDPDPTGGFYLPVRAALGALTAFAMERVTCNLPNAPLDVAVAIEKQYRRNQNPALLPLTASVGGVAVSLDAIPANARVVLATGWRDEDAERYVMFDPERAALVERREALRVAWFVTAGELTYEVTGRDEHDLATTTENEWQAPSSGVAHGWVVLRDSRGGVDFSSHDFAIQPAAREPPP